MNEPTAVVVFVLNVKFDRETVKTTLKIVFVCKYLLKMLFQVLSVGFDYIYMS